MNIFIKAEYTFRVYPENLDFTRDDVFKYQIDEGTEIEVLLGEIEETIKEVMKIKGCELLEVKFSQSHELAYMKNNKKPAHYARYKIRKAEERKKKLLR